LVILPGIIAALIIPNLGSTDDPSLNYTNAIPLLMGTLLPTGVLGIAVTGLVAAFMAGMAANVSSFNAVTTYDIWQQYIVKDRADKYYLNFGRIITIFGVVAGIGTAFIASRYNNINDYLQTLFSFFQAPVFITFILGMFWKRTTAWGGFYGLVSGIFAAGSIWGFAILNPEFFRSAFQQAMWMGIVAGAVDLVVTVAVTMKTEPKPEHELVGLVKGLELPGQAGPPASTWYRSPATLGIAAIALALSMYIPFFVWG